MAAQRNEPDELFWHEITIWLGEKMAFWKCTQEENQNIFADVRILICQKDWRDFFS